MSLQLVIGRTVPFFVASWCAAVSMAQATPAAEAPVTVTAQEPAPAQEPAATSQALGSITADAAEMRCWPTANSPAYEGALPKDAVVALGRTEAGYREVTLPLGPIGYVHKSFCGDATPEGKVAIKSKSVAFRYRPKSGEAPVTTLAAGHELWLIGDQEDWWKVRNPQITCWVHETEVQGFDNPPETMVLAYAELAKVQRGEVAQRIEAMQQAAAQKQQASEQLAEMAALQNAFQQELQKDPREQQWAPILASTDALAARLAEGSELKPMCEELKRRIGVQQWVVEATAVRDEQPVPPQNLPVVAPGVVPDALDRFQSVGFLRWTKGFTGPGRYVVEKGGKQLFEVTCNSGRYDLSLFVDCEVGLIGQSQRPSFESLRVLDVEKIEVLAARP